MRFALFSEDSVNKLLQHSLDRGQWSKAAEQYRRLIKLHPENINLRLRLAEVCVKSGNKKEALEQYEMVAEYYVGLENLSKAVTILRTMLNIDSGLSQIRIKLAELYAALGNTEEMWNQYLTAVKYLEEKKLVTQSVTVLERMAKLKLNDPKLMIQLAEMFLARDLQPQAVGQFLSVAELFLQKREIKTATKYYKRALSIDSGIREAKKGLEVLHYLADKPAQPVTPATAGEATPTSQVTTEAVTQKPADEELDDLLAQTLNQRTTSQGDLQNHYNLGMVYQEMALLDAAIEEFIQAASDSKLQPECYQRLSRCFEQKGMARHAQKYQQMYLSQQVAS